MTEIYHIVRFDERLCTFYDRRWLGDMLEAMFPLGAIPNVVIQVDDQDGNVRTLCTVADARFKGREWLMCKEAQ